MTTGKRSYLILALAASIALAGSAVTLASGPAVGRRARGRRRFSLRQQQRHGQRPGIRRRDRAFERKFASGGGLIEPEGIAFGPDGNLYVAAAAMKCFVTTGRPGKFIDVFASGHGLVDPAGIAFGGPGNDLFVGSGLTDDGRGNQILRFDGATGAFEAVVDPANAAGLDDPEALAFGRMACSMSPALRNRTRRGPSLRPSDQLVRRHVRPRSEQQHPGSDRPGLRPRRRPVPQQRRDERGQALRRHDRRLRRRLRHRWPRRPQ